MRADRRDNVSLDSETGRQTIQLLSRSGGYRIDYEAQALS